MAIALQRWADVPDPKAAAEMATVADGHGPGERGEEGSSERDLLPNGCAQELFIPVQLAVGSP